MIISSKIRSHDTRRFDRSSWLTLAVAFIFITLSGSIMTASYHMPADGWFIDRGPWGRYENPIYQAPISDRPSSLQEGDILVAAEGVPFDRLERAAASLKPLRPASWQLGETIQYTVLRDGREVEASALLSRPTVLAAFRPALLRYSFFALAELAFFIMGAVIFVLRPRERAAQLLFIFGLAFLNDDLLSAFVIPASVGDLFSTVIYWPKIILGNLSWSYLIGPLLIYFFLIFPVKKWPVRRFPRLTPLLLFGIFAVNTIVFVIFNIQGGYLDWTQANLLLVLIPISLVHSLLTVKDPVARLQVRWLVFGGLIGVTCPILVWFASGGISVASPIWLILLFMSLFVVFPISLAVAILRYRLWGIDIIINRTLVYGALTTTLAVLYFGLVTILQDFVVTITGEQSSIAIVISTLAIAALFTPLRHRIQDFIDRRFYRRKYDAAKELTAFSYAVREEVELDNLAEDLLGVVERTLQPESVSIWLRVARRPQSQPPGHPFPFPSK
jgi:hypothetical protein